MRLRSIEQKIFLLILPICLIPPVIFLALFSIGTLLTFEETIGAEISSRAKYLADRFDRFLEARAERLRGLARDGGDDLDHLAALMREWGGVDAIAHLDPAGKARVVGRPSLDEPWLATIRAGHLLRRWGDQAQAGGMLESLVEIRLEQPGRTVNLTAMVFPATPQGRLFFFARTSQLVREFRQSMPLNQDPFLIYSRDGGVIDTGEGIDAALPGALYEALGERGAAGGWFKVRGRRDSWLIAPAATQRVRGLMPASQTRAPAWYVLMQYDQENFIGPLARMFWLSVALVLGMALATLGIGYLAARQLISPLLKLRRQAEALAGGDLDVRASIRSRDEIGDLAEAFNIMAARLRTTYQRLEERLEENELRARHINAVNEITSAIIQVLSLDRIFEILNAELDKILPFDALWIALYDGGRHRLAVAHIKPAELISAFERGAIPLESSIHGHVFETREALHAELGPRQPATGLCEAALFRAAGLQSFLIAPLPARNRVIGTLTVASRAPDGFSPRLAPIMTSLAGAVAIAIEQTELFHRISSFATDLERKVADRSHELELATQKLIQTEKYFATGRMAGNLAHEINNPLGIIKNYIQLVKNNLREAGGGRRKSDINLENLEVIDEEVNRIARMVRQMLNLHRPVEQAVQPVDLNHMLRDILALMEEDLQRTRVEVTVELAPDLPRPVASPDLLRQLFINLIRNAQDAMEKEGGRLTVRTSFISLWRDGAERQALLIRIADTGCGIPSEHQSQIFDPFFTTKSPERGTGLGLCVSYSIVSMYHGTIDVESEPGRGTAIIVTLPVEIPAETPPDAQATRITEKDLLP